MKKFLFVVLAFTTMAAAFCTYISKSGEYDGGRSYSYGSVVSSKICVYKKWHIPVAQFNQHYCPYAIEIDEFSQSLCNFH